MKKLWAAALTLLTALATPMIDSAIARSARGAAIAATSLGSFEGIEEPLVIYHPSTATFTDDSYINIVDEGGGMFRYTLRYRPDLDYFDGDRATTNNDRQRAEVKGLGAHQATNQTFEYTYDWRTDSNFIGTSTFCHIFQLKATDGDNAPPLVTSVPITWKIAT
jgi:hypothetical protein